MVLFLENVFSAIIMRIYWQKNRKKLQLEKLEKYEEGAFFRKKTNYFLT